MRPTHPSLAFARPIFLYHSSPLEFLIRPQLLTRRSPLPTGEDISWLTRCIVCPLSSSMDLRNRCWDRTSCAPPERQK